jgi:CheY-like chemotaxis protein
VENALTILLVEDDENDVFWFRRCLSAIAARVNIRVVENAWLARNYLEGMTPFSDRAYYPIPDLIVADFHLPGASGLDLIRWLKSDARFKDIPVFTSSGSMKDEECRALQEAGINAHFVKTPNFDLARENVRSMLEHVKKS